MSDDLLDGRGLPPAGSAAEWQRGSLDELAHELPWDRPDPARRTARRTALLAAARAERPAAGHVAPGRWRRIAAIVAIVGGGGALAAAAIARDAGQVQRVEPSLTPPASPPAAPPASPPTARPASPPAVPPAPTPSPAPAPAPARVIAAPSPPRVTAPSPPRVTTAPSPIAPALAPSIAPSETERRFAAGLAELRANQPRGAALELAAAADRADGELALDARYFEAVARSRAGDLAAAERAIQRFLADAPRSLRRGRALILLGHLCAARGDTRAARVALEAARVDRDPEVASAALTGLSALPAP